MTDVEQIEHIYIHADGGKLTGKDLKEEPAERYCEYADKFIKENTAGAIDWSIFEREQAIMEARTVEQTEVFAADVEFAKVEGILPAPESSHAIKVAIDEALKCKETGEEKTIVFCLTGTGYFDMYAYERFNNGEMGDYIPTEEELKHGFDSLLDIEG